MMENLTPSKTRIGPKRLKLVAIKDLWKVRDAFQKKKKSVWRENVPTGGKGVKKKIQKIPT